MHSFPEARNVKIETFLFLHQILHTRRVDSPVMMLIQIRAMVSRGMLPPRIFFSLKWCNLGKFCVFQNTLLSS